MRILHLAAFVQGSAGFAVTELATQQQAAGHAVAVVTSKTGVAPYGNNPEHVQALKRAGVGLFAIDSLFRRDHAANLNVVGFIHEQLGPAPFDIMHSHAPVASLVAIVAASGTPARVVQTMHRWGVRKSAAQTQSDVAVLRQLPRVIVRDESSRPMLIGLGVAPGRISVISYGVRPNDDPFDGLDLTDADLRLVRDVRLSGRPVVCCIGTVGPAGNQRLLVDALTAIPAARRPFCMVVGGGEVGRLTLYARTRGADGAIRFCGYKPNARRFLRASDCLVLPGPSDGVPLTVLEAFCDRVPVVAGEGPALRELMGEHAICTLARGNDAALLAAAIRSALEMTPDSRNQMRHAAHQVYRARFTAASMHDRYAAEYRRLLSGAAACGDEALAA